MFSCKILGFSRRDSEVNETFRLAICRGTDRVTGRLRGKGNGFDGVRKMFSEFME